MADFTQWEDVKRYLDDPNVSEDEKARILRIYSDGNATHHQFGEVNEDYWENRDEILAYAEEYDLKDHVEDNEEAKSEEDIAHDQERLDEVIARADEDIARAQAGADLEAAAGKTVTQGGSGVATSDELLEPGSRGLYFFELFIPPYQNWTGTALDLDADFKEPYDELKEIGFAKFRADADAMNDVHTELLEIARDINSQTDVMQTFWTGPAADAADDYCRVFQADANIVVDSPETVAALITEGIGHIENAVLTRAQKVFELAADRVGGQIPDVVWGVIKAARGEMGKQGLKNMVVRRWPMFTGIDPDSFDFYWDFHEDEVRESMARSATTWLDGTFVTEFNEKKELFDTTCKSTKELVKEDWDTILEGLNAIEENPFSNLDGGIQYEPAQTTSTTGPAATDPTTTSTAPATPTAPTTSGAVAEETPRPVPPADDLINSGTEPAGDDGGSSSSGGGGGSFGGGSSGGGSSSGGGGGGGSFAPVPPAPVLGDVGRPPAPPDAFPLPLPEPMPTPDAEKPDSVTVSDGTNSYTITEPDENGLATLTVDTGDGSPMTYDLDFGAVGADDSWSPDNETVRPQPGDDGKITIQDGDMTITAERPGGLGEPITITVDDGTGEPTTYTVDIAGSPDEPRPLVPMWRDTEASVNTPATAVHDRVAGAGDIPHGGGGTGVPAAASASGHGAGGMMPMMPMGAGMGGGDHDRGGNRWQISEDSFDEDVSAIARVNEVLNPGAK